MSANNDGVNRLISWVLVPLVLAGLGSLFFVVYYSGVSHGRNTEPAFKSSGPTQKKLEAMGHLTVLKISLADILEGHDAGYRGVWLVKGDAVYMIDMRNCKLKERNEREHKAILALPLPEISRPRVDHEKTKTYSFTKNTYIPFTGQPDQLRDEAMLEAQKLIERAASNDEYVEVAKRNAELTLKNIYDMVDWQMSVEWAPTK